MATTPGTMMPCRKRQKMSWPSDVEVAASRVGMEMPSSEATITRLRASRSVSTPKMGAESATPSVAAETVNPTPVFEAWKRCVNNGSNGWVQ